MGGVRVLLFSINQTNRVDNYIKWRLDLTDPEDSQDKGGRTEINEGLSVRNAEEATNGIGKSGRSGLFRHWALSVGNYVQNDNIMKPFIKYFQNFLYHTPVNEYQRSIFKTTFRKE